MLTLMIELKNIEGVFWIDREEAVKNLTNGFLELFGEENRDFFESLQDSMIDEGIKAGKIGFRLKSFGRLSMYRLIQKYNTDEKNELLKKWFLKFFTEEEYYIVANEKKIDTNGASDSVYKFYKNTDYYQNLFVDRFSVINCDGHCEPGDCMCNSEPPKLYRKSPPSFKYFKKLKHSFLGLNMFGEGGMGLERWNKSELNYMLEEG